VRSAAWRGRPAAPRRAGAGTAATTAATTAAAAAFTAEAAATRAAATEATRLLLARLGRIDSQRTSAEFLTVHGIGRFLDTGGVSQGHEAKPARAAGFTIRDDFHFLHRTEGGEEFGHFFFRGGEGQVAHVDVHCL
jgi:hypothetical protein